jgi:hypothetical protein
MASQYDSDRSQDVYSVAEKYQMKQKKRITKTFTVFAPFVLICVLAICRVLLCSSVFWLFVGYFCDHLCFGYCYGTLVLICIFATCWVLFCPSVFWLLVDNFVFICGWIFLGLFCLVLLGSFVFWLFVGDFWFHLWFTILVFSSSVLFDYIYRILSHSSIPVLLCIGWVLLCPSVSWLWVSFVCIYPCLCL